MSIQLNTNGLFLLSEEQIPATAKTRTAWSVSKIELLAVFNKALSPQIVKEAYLLKIYDEHNVAYNELVFLSAGQKDHIQNKLDRHSRIITIPAYDNYTSSALSNMSHSFLHNEALNIQAIDWHIQNGASPESPDENAVLDNKHVKLSFYQLEYDKINNIISIL